MKVRVKNYELSIKGLLILFLLPVILNTYPLSPVYAVDSTPSSDVKSKLEQLKLEIASKAAKLKTEVNRKLQNKAYTGIVKSKSETSITLASKTATKLVSVNQDTLYEDQTPVKKGTKKVAPSINTLKEESNIAALGDVDDTGVLHAKKIVTIPLPTSNFQLPTYLWGQIISESDDLITVRNKESKNETVSVFKIKTKFKPDDFVIITGVKGKNEIIEASFLYVIPKGVVLKPKISTPSATPKPTTKPK